MPAAQTPIDLVRRRLRMVLTLGVAITALMGASGLVAFGVEASDFFISFAFTSSILLILMAIGAWLSGEELQRDVNLLADGVEAIGGADGLSRAMSVYSTDELAAVAVEIDRLRKHIVAVLEGERELKRRLESADRYKTEFLTAVSHELRNPLNSILGFTDVLLQELDGPLNGEQRQDLGIIRSAGTHLRELFSDVLDLSAAVSDRLELHREPTEIGELLEEVAAELSGQLRDRPVEIRVEVGELPPVDVDPRRMRQIVTNLASNAMKFTVEGEVVLSATCRGEDVRVAVRDTGVGIAEEDQARIFVEFGQSDDERRRRRGAGLGLAITKRLTELHGGTISVSSELGTGSVFTVDMPGCRGES